MYVVTNIHNKVKNICISYRPSSVTIQRKPCLSFSFCILYTRSPALGFPGFLSGWQAKALTLNSLTICSV